MKRIACIYFPISSVGGIATVAASLARAARARGDVFDVLRSSNAKRIEPGKFATGPARIRGGDTHIVIDGEAPHGAQFARTKKWLEDNYDALFFVHPCCHPTKAYGNNPFWLDMYDVALPKAMRFCDGYAETYPWVKSAVPKCAEVYVDQEAYAIPLVKMGIKYKLMPQPFFAEKVTAKRSPERLTIFPNQWKQIKCPEEFLRAIPGMEGRVELYSNGIEYYNLRLTPLWSQVIAEDRFTGTKPNRRARAIFHGNVPYPTILKAFQSAWSMVDLMGQRAKIGAYRAGAYNYTSVEALYYGCRPILHDLARKSALPEDLIVTIDLGPKHAAFERIATAANEARPLSPREVARAREWIASRHDAGKIYEGLRRVLK
jgi:hypothetical protein